MYLKYVMVILCCVMGHVQASCLKKKSGSKSTGALPTVVSIFTVEKKSGESSCVGSSALDVCSVVPEENLNASCSTQAIAVPAPSAPSMYYEFPGGNSPVYSSPEEYIKNCFWGPTSPIRGLFPCGR